MTERVKLILDAYKSRKSARARLNQLLEEIAEVISPERCGFTNSDSYTRRQTRIYDTSPVIAKRGLVNAISGMLRLKTTSSGFWNNIVPEDDKLLEDTEVKAWLDLWVHSKEKRTTVGNLVRIRSRRCVLRSSQCWWWGANPYRPAPALRTKR